MKHMELKYASLQDDIREKEIVIKYRKTEDNVADFLTKGLKNETFSRDRELAGVVKYKDQVSDARRVRITGKQMVALIFIAQISGVGAIMPDVEFLSYCWLLGLGVLMMMMGFVRVVLKCLWNTPCRMMIESTVSSWDYLMEMLKISTYAESKWIYLCNTGERFHTHRGCNHVTDKTNRQELKSGVKHIRMCDHCRRLGWDSENVHI